MSRRHMQTVVISLAAAAWVVGVVAGAGALWRHQSTPGPVAAPPASWPDEVDGLSAPTGAPALLLFAHPRCPCTRASIEETARILAGAGGGVDVRFVFRVPERADASWTDGDSWRRASAIPGAATISDPGGVLHAVFGVTTSGHALLYDAGGSLLFSGGVTGSRGHEGANPGRSAIAALLRGEAPAVRETPVYGCPLADALRESAP